ncbi:MAG: glycine cleavage system aminomethyltransferase GcvT [Bdellovibrionota bacterium]
MTTKKIALDSYHRNLKARMVPFAGYDMPVSYKGIIEEHKAVRSGVGIFDVSHMGIVTLRGAGALSFADKMFTKPASKVALGRGAYALLCNEKGQPLDDLIFYRTGEAELVVALNASNKESDLAWLQKHAPSDVEFDSRFETHSLFAIQGARASDFLKILGVELNFDQLYGSGIFEVGGIKAQYFVSGYTGEKGCEVSVPNEFAEKLFDFFLKVETSLKDESGAPLAVQPCGLGCRDTLRLEMGYSLYGHELSLDINPIEAGLSWAIDLNSNFLGRDALALYKEKPLRKMIALQNKESRQAPRAEMKVLDSTGTECGFITSGTFSPSLGYVVGLAVVGTSSQAPYSVDMRGNKVIFETTKRPFYKKG